MIIAINLYVIVDSYQIYAKNEEFYGYVRHIEYNLDGSVEIEISSEDYGRLLYKTAEDCLKPGQSLYIYGDIYMPDPPTNPGQFDYARYLKRRGINGILKPKIVRVIGSTGLLDRIAAFLVQESYNIRCYALSFFDEDDRALAAAVFMGDSSLVEEDVIRAFKLSNCSHLLAVSGTHFSGFLMILASVISASRMKKRYSAPLYIVFCILVGTFTGWSGSVTRAAIMSICAFLCRDFLSGMALATIMIFVEDPFGCLSSGYMMSFAASLSIHFLSDSIHKRLTGISVPDSLANILSPVFAAMIGMMPFWGRNCYYFSFLHLFVQIIGSFVATVACVFFIPSVITGLPFACSCMLRLLLYLMRLCSSVSIEGACLKRIT
jgi:Predicted membrane metal-binding protein